jgi:hypothetical protein
MRNILFLTSLAALTGCMDNDQSVETGAGAGGVDPWFNNAGGLSGMDTRPEASSGSSDPEPAGPGDARHDNDNDGVPNAEDNCPEHYNPEQEDFDNDANGDACDLDRDGDNVGDAIDPDQDSYWTCEQQAQRCEVLCQDGSHPDWCSHPAVGNVEAEAGCLCDEGWVPEQSDTIPEDDDADSDGIVDWQDNCPDDSNAQQADYDRDGLGDACDAELNCEGYDDCPRGFGGVDVCINPQCRAGVCQYSRTSMFTFCVPCQRHEDCTGRDFCGPGLESVIEALDCNRLGYCAQADRECPQDTACDVTSHTCN